MDFPLLSTNRWPLIIGHRGVSGLALENSVAAFALAGNQGGVPYCDAVELDIHTTIDGEFIVHHNPVLATGERISAVPASRVRASSLPDGSPVPTLAIALELLADLTVFVEAKSLPAAADRALLALLREHGLERSAVHAFDHRIVARLRREDDEIRLGVLSESYPVDPVRPILDAGATMLWQAQHLIDAALVGACHDTGCAVIAWTVNDAVEAASLAALGVDGLCGNWPERLRDQRR